MLIKRSVLWIINFSPLLKTYETINSIILSTFWKSLGKKICRVNFQRLISGKQNIYLRTIK